MTQRGKSCEELIRLGLSERGICSALRMSPNTVTKIRSNDKDDQLIQLVQEHGHRWQRIGNLLDVPSMAAKNRYNFLTRKQANMRHRDWRPLPSVTEIEVLPELENLSEASIFDIPTLQAA